MTQKNNTNETAAHTSHEKKTNHEPDPEQLIVIAKECEKIKQTAAKNGTKPNWSQASPEVQAHILNQVAGVNHCAQIEHIHSEFGTVEIEDTATRNLYLKECRKTECEPLQVSFDPDLRKTLHKLAVLYPAGFIRAVADVLWSKEVAIDPPHDLNELEGILCIASLAADSGTTKELWSTVAEWDRQTN